MPIIVLNHRQPDGQPILTEGEVVRLRVPQTELFLASQPSAGKGTLYITTSNVVWLSDADAARGYSIDFHSIIIHAVSKDTSYFAHACIYCQLEAGDEEVSELRFVPPPDVTLESIYSVMNACAALNPDEGADDEDDDDDDFFWNGEPANDAAADERLKHLESVFQAPNGDHPDEMMDNDEEEDEDDAEDGENHNGHTHMQH